MMFRHSFALGEEAASIESAVEKVLAEGWRTSDIHSPGMKKVPGSRMGELILKELE
jgi:3-isopropylmalate dehydrogenase